MQNSPSYTHPIPSPEQGATGTVSALLEHQNLPQIPHLLNRVILFVPYCNNFTIISPQISARIDLIRFVQYDREI